MFFNYFSLKFAIAHSFYTPYCSYLSDMNLYNIASEIFGSGTGVKASFDAVAVLGL